MTRILHITKSEYKLRVLEGTTIIREYPIAIGERTDGKARIYEEDFRTPEGKFTIKLVTLLANSENWQPRLPVQPNLAYYPFYLAHKFGKPFEDAGRNVYGNGLIGLDFPLPPDIIRYYSFLETGEVLRDWREFMEEKWKPIFEHIAETTHIPFDQVTLNHPSRRNQKCFLEDKTFAQLFNYTPPQPTSPTGIHGTNDSDCMGHKISGGCIRLHNKDIFELIVEFVKEGMEVIIEN